MANWTDSVKIRKLFKALQNKSDTSDSKKFYEENIPYYPDIHNDDIYADPIPSTPPSSSTSVVKCWTDSADGRIVLTKDNSVAGNRAWVALNTWQSGWSSGSGDVSQILKNFISPKYGKDYVVKVYHGNGTQISELDNVSWIFNYKAGVLTFEQDPGDNGSSPSTSIQIEVYQYVGTFGGSGGGTGSGEITEKQITQTNHGLNVNDVIYLNQNTQLYERANASDEETAEVVGIVSEVIDANTFKFIMEGYYAASGLPGAVGEVLYLSDSVDGRLTNTAPDPPSVNKPIGVRTSDGMIVYTLRGLIASGGEGSAVTSENVTKVVNQISHTFNVGDWLYHTTANTYARTNANDPVKADTVGVVVEVIDADNFRLLMSGYFTQTGLPGTAGDSLFLDTNDGQITDVPPSIAGYVVKPVGIRTSDGMIVNIMRGNIIGNEEEQEVEFVEKTIIQNSHGFNVNDWLYHKDDGTYDLADASQESTSEVVGVVTEVPDVNTFKLRLFGYYVWGTAPGSTGDKLYLSTTPGQVDYIAPTAVGQVVKQVGVRTNDGVIINITKGEVIQSGGSGNSESLSRNINQNNHGFSVGQVLRLDENNGGDYYLLAGRLDTPVGIVVSVIDSDNFVLGIHGYFAISVTGNIGDRLFPSDTPGDLTNVGWPESYSVGIRTESGIYINITAPEDGGRRVIAQSSHPWETGDPLWHDGTSYGIANATNPQSLDRFVGVARKISNDLFEIYYNGFMPWPGAPGTGGDPLYITHQGLIQTSTQGIRKQIATRVENGIVVRAQHNHPDSLDEYRINIDKDGNDSSVGGRFVIRTAEDTSPLDIFAVEGKGRTQIFPQGIPHNLKSNNRWYINSLFSNKLSDSDLQGVLDTINLHSGDDNYKGLIALDTGVYSRAEITANFKRVHIRGVDGYHTVIRGSNSDPALRIDGAEYVILENLSFDGSGTYGTAVEISNANVVVIRNITDVPPGYSTAADVGYGLFSFRHVNFIFVENVVIQGLDNGSNRAIIGNKVFDFDYVSEVNVDRLFFRNPHTAGATIQFPNANRVGSFKMSNYTIDASEINNSAATIFKQLFGGYVPSRLELYNGKLINTQLYYNHPAGIEEYVTIIDNFESISKIDQDAWAINDSSSWGKRCMFTLTNGVFFDNNLGRQYGVRLLPGNNTTNSSPDNERHLIRIDSVWHTSGTFISIENPIVASVNSTNLILRAIADGNSLSYNIDNNVLNNVDKVIIY